MSFCFSFDWLDDNMVTASVASVTDGSIQVLAMQRERRRRPNGHPTEGIVHCEALAEAMGAMEQFFRVGVSTRPVGEAR